MILGAESLVHSSCTTAVEAYLLDKPTIAVQPALIDHRMDSPLPNFLSRRGASWHAVVSLTIEAATRKSRWETQKQVRLAAEHIGATIPAKLLVDERRVFAAKAVRAVVTPHKRPSLVPNIIPRELGRGPKDATNRHGELRFDEIEESLSQIGSLPGCRFHCENAGLGAIAFEMLSP